MKTLITKLKQQEKIVTPAEMQKIRGGVQDTTPIGETVYRGEF